MSQNQPRNLLPDGGVFHNLATRVKLILKLMSDPRVNTWLKLIPVASLVYLLFPDVMPGPFDDAAVIWLSTYLFVELCPQDVVQEHLETLNQVIPGEWRDAGEGSGKTSHAEVIEGEFRDP